MPVVIDDLDVEVAPTQPAAPTAVPGPPAAAAPTADHLADHLHQLAARHERVRAD